MAADRAVAAGGLSDDYAGAAAAVAGQESLERKYRLEPGPGVRAMYDAAAADLVTALARVSADGDAGDQARVARLLDAHADYLAQTRLLFRAVDEDDPAGVLRADAATEVLFARIDALVGEAARAHHDTSLTELDRLRSLETLTRHLMPLVFLVGLLLTGLLASVGAGHRRLLDAARARTVHGSLHDGLTGLPNRTLLAERVEHALTHARDGTRAALLLIDLDHFKDVNDTFGHHYGDALLRQVGPRLAGVLRDSDTVARLGGDEFAVLLPDVASVTDATQVATKLVAALEQPFHVEGVDLDVEASIGVVVSGEHGTDSRLLLQRADIAMYVAKSQNLGVAIYDPAVDGHSPAKLALLGDLRRALDRGQLVLHYQPKLSISTGAVTGVEALVRWQHPERGLVSPDNFIPLAERTGLIGPLTRQVLDTALAQARAWSDAGRPLAVSVNLSARNLLDERLPAQVAELLAAHGVPAALLELEVTESAIMTEPVRARRLLQELAALGVRLSLDDFGAGYTSLGQLRSLPISELKIDRSFVLTMVEDRSNALIVQSVVDLGHNLGLTLVAEGVESASALAALAALGCDVAQGYHLSRPLPCAEFDLWRADRGMPPRPAAHCAPQAGTFTAASTARPSTAVTATSTT